MRGLFVGLLLVQAFPASGVTPKPEPRHFLYNRSVSVSERVADVQACASLDEAVYAHGAEALKDLRLFGQAAGQSAREIPYAVTLSQAAGEESESAKVLNLGKRGGRLVFDLAMPGRAYTEVLLDLAGHDFIATADVTGTNSAKAKPTSLGSFTLFDLSQQHLARSTVLHLTESRFPFLHVELSVTGAPGQIGLSAPGITVQGASVPPSREAQTLFTTAVEASSMVQKGQKTVANFYLPAHVPVERVSFEVAPGYSGSFSRTVEVSARPKIGSRHRTGYDQDETVRGAIERVRLTRAGSEIRQEQMSVPATLGSNLQGDASVEVAIKNGDDAPLPLTAVRLEMRQRKVCFPVQPLGTALMLFYGDGALEAPQYDLERVLSQRGDMPAAQLGPEEKNPGYVARASSVKSLTERHPELVWVGLLGVVCVLAVVALHSARRVQR